MLIAIDASAIDRRLGEQYQRMARRSLIAIGASAVGRRRGFPPGSTPR